MATFKEMMEEIAKAIKAVLDEEEKELEIPKEEKNEKTTLDI